MRRARDLILKKHKTKGTDTNFGIWGFLFYTAIGLRSSKKDFPICRLAEMSESEITCVDLPVIDISEDLSESTLSSLYAACSDWGFFYITNHGVSKQFYQKLISLADELFGLPQDAKIKVGISSYVPRFTASPFFESFKLAGPDFSASARLLTEGLFGHSNTEFRYQ